MSPTPPPRLGDVPPLDVVVGQVEVGDDGERFGEIRQGADDAGRGGALLDEVLAAEGDEAQVEHAPDQLRVSGVPGGGDREVGGGFDLGLAAVGTGEDGPQRQPAGPVRGVLGQPVEGGVERMGQICGHGAEPERDPDPMRDGGVHGHHHTHRVVTGGRQGHLDGGEPLVVAAGRVPGGGESERKVVPRQGGGPRQGVGGEGLLPERHGVLVGQPAGRGSSGSAAELRRGGRLVRTQLSGGQPVPGDRGVQLLPVTAGPGQCGRAPQVPDRLPRRRPAVQQGVDDQRVGEPDAGRPASGGDQAGLVCGVEARDGLVERTVGDLRDEPRLGLVADDGCALEDGDGRLAEPLHAVPDDVSDRGRDRSLVSGEGAEEEGVPAGAGVQVGRPAGPGIGTGRRGDEGTDVVEV